MFDLLFAPLGYGFFVTALLTGSAICLVAALVGTHLTFKGFSMLGDGLSHVGFGAVAVASSLGLAPLAVAVPAAILTAFLLLSLSRRSKASADSSVALLSAVGLAVGVVAVSRAGVSFDLNAYLFGSVLAIEQDTAPAVILICASLFVLYLLCYPAFFSLTADESFFSAQTRTAALFRSLLAAIAAVVVVVGMQSVGALLISALLIFPPSAAKHVSSSFCATVILSAVFSVVSFVAGLYLSFYLSLPAGASVVLTNAALFLVCLLCGKLKRKK